MESEENRDRRPLEIRDPEIDEAGFLDRVRENLAQRTPLDPPVTSESSVVRAEHRELLASIENLRVAMSRHGGLGIRRPGWRGRITWLAKHFIRKLVQRHLDQQQEVHQAALDALERTAALLERMERPSEDDPARGPE